MSLETFISRFEVLHIWVFLATLLCQHAGVCEKNIPFTQALAMQPSSSNPSPAPDLVLCKLIFPRAFFSGGLFFFSQTLVF